MIEAVKTEKVASTLTIGTTKPLNRRTDKSKTVRSSTLFWFFSLLVKSLRNAYAIHGKQVVYVPKRFLTSLCEVSHQTLFETFLGRTYIGIKALFQGKILSCTKLNV
ncbi:MAG: hypothetical protein QXG76_01980 [Candidatus Bathyarchaeia archaeon]